MAREPSLGRALDAHLVMALTRPRSLGRHTARVLLRALPPESSDEAVGERAVAVIAALLYARADLVGEPVLAGLAELIRVKPLNDRARAAVSKIFEFLASSGWAGWAWRQLGDLVRDERVAQATRHTLLPLVGDFVRWRAGVADLGEILDLAESPALTEHRPALLEHGVEPFAFSTPHAFTEARLARLEALFARVPRYRYVLYSLGARRHLADDVRTWLARRLPEHFPLWRPAASVLKARPVELLVVHNVRMGQGDDVVCVVPLLQALLDANPALSVALVTHRTHLYDHPRVTTISIHDDRAFQGALARELDGVIEFFGPGWRGSAFRPELHSAIEGLVKTRRLPFVITAALGPPGGDDRRDRCDFRFPRVELTGLDIAASRGLDRNDLRNVYEPCLRLLAELGLPQRAAEEPPLAPPILTGVRSMDAERVWQRLVSRRAGDALRPVALVNPFGGSLATKGLFEQPHLLAAEIEGLVEEGYLVVLVSNGTEWGGRAAVATALSLLTRQTRAHIQQAPAPDLIESTPSDRPERPDLTEADRIVRMIKYFVTYADLVVTVEGWIAHLAYCLGRPFRLFLAAGSFSSAWYPYGRGPNQRLVTTLSERARAFAAADLLGPHNPPPLAHRPRKTLLEVALAGLGRSDRPERRAILRRALASADHEVRAWAIAALGRSAPIEEVKDDLLAALEDREPAVVRAAAEALLDSGADCARELGAHYREQLGLYVDIARHRWDAMQGVGPAALPALFRAASSADYAIHREATLRLRRLLASYVPRLPPEARPRVRFPGGGSMSYSDATRRATWRGEPT